MENNYDISDKSKSFIPQEICYLNFKHFIMEYHQHSPGSIELNYIVDGECIYDISGKIFALPKRSLILVNGNIPHRLLISSGCINMSINCSQQQLPHSFGTLGDLIAACPLLENMFNDLETGIIFRNAKIIYPLLQSICDEYNGNNDSNYLNLLTNKAFMDINRFFLSSDSALMSQPSQYVFQIKNYIAYHFFEISSIDDIARHIALNKIYLQKIFKQETGMTLWRYLTKFRMQKATYYLSNTTVPIGEIDEIIGIHSRQNFYLLFKREYGISPSEYRKLHSKNGLS